MLHGTPPTDPVGYGAVAVLIVGMALAASYGPARRAAMVAPAVTLRGG